jgi:hypothetical protein
MNKEHAKARILGHLCKTVPGWRDDPVINSIIDAIEPEEKPEQPRELTLEDRIRDFSYNWVCSETRHDVQIDMSRIANAIQAETLKAVRDALFDDRHGWAGYGKSQERIDAKIKELEQVK